MKVLIVEDEPFASERLRKLIAQHDARITVVDELDSVEDAVHFFQSGRATDLLFLDIQLSDGVSFEIFERTHRSLPGGLHHRLRSICATSLSGAGY